MLFSSSEVNSGLFLSAHLLPKMKNCRDELDECSRLFTEVMLVFTCLHVHENV